MKYSEIFRTFTNYIYDRATNPFIWIFITCFSLDHWNDILVLLLSSDDIHDKISYINNSISESKIFPILTSNNLIDLAGADLNTPKIESHNYIGYLLNPFISALLISAFYPYLSVALSYLSNMADSLKNSISYKFDNAKYLDKDASIELKDERARMIEMFHKQILDHQNENRQVHERLMNSQMNCNALYCCLKLNEGNANLLPYATGYNSFIARNENQTDLLMFINKLYDINSNLNNSNVETLITKLKEADLVVMGSLYGMNDDEFMRLIKELGDQGALLLRNYKLSKGNDISLETRIQLTQSARKFCTVMDSLKGNTNFDYTKLS